jgi:hypothetical protein
VLRVVVIIAALLLPVTAAHGDLFEIFVTNTDGSGIPDLQVGGFELPELLEDLINGQDAFAAFAGAAFSADITFAGIENAINVTVDPATQTATITFTILGAGAQTFTFTGADLWQQLEQALQDNIANAISELMNQLNQLSAIAITDGAPLSTTALATDYVFERFGLHADLTADERRAAEAGNGEDDVGLRGRLDAWYDNIDTDVADATVIAIAPSLEYVFNQDLSLGFLVPIVYHDIGGAEVLNVHFNLAMPWTVVHAGDLSPVDVRVTPFGTLAVVGSVDMLSGGAIGGGGVLSTVTLPLGSMTISGSAQYAVYESIGLRYESWELDPNVSQQMVKVGGKLTQYLGDNMYVYGTISYTSFLQDAAVDDWVSPGAGFGYRLDDGLNVSVGWDSDFADGYDSYNVRATFQLPF